MLCVSVEVGAVLDWAGASGAVVVDVGVCDGVDWGEAPDPLWRVTSCLVLGS